MPDRTEIANAALTMLGEQSIMNIDDESDTARAVQRIYAITLDAALRDHNWNFATLRRDLAEVADTPTFGFDHMYILPTDPYCLRVVTTNLTPDVKWSIETYESGATRSRVIVTDACSVAIVYVARMTDPTVWDGLFVDAFTFELASRIGYALSGKEQLAQGLAARAELAWRKARARDGQEGRPLRRLLSTSFTEVR